MPDATPFLQAILDAPNNDAPRLVYADWLDEHGDAHGELIRVQCELSRHRIGDPDRRDLEQRERRLLSKHAVAWFGPLKSLRRDDNPTRGFLPPIKLSAWQAHYGHWTDSPLPLRVELDHTLASHPQRDPALASLLDSPRLGRLTGLRLRPPEPELPDRWSSIHYGETAVLDARAIRAQVDWACTALASLHRRLLRTLDLSNSPLTPEALERLFDCPHLRGLGRLSLRRTGLNDAALAKLARCPHLADLTDLDLTGNPLADLTPLLAPGSLPRLRHLHLGKNGQLAPWMQLELQARFGRRVSF